MCIQGTWSDALIVQAVADALNVVIHIVESNPGFSPTTTVYPVQERNSLSTITIGHIDVLNTSKEGEVVTVQGKILGLKDQRIVGSPRKKLTLVEAFLDDGSGRIPIDIWESHIENVKTGRYCNVFKTCQKNAVLMYQSNRSFGSPP